MLAIVQAISQADRDKLGWIAGIFCAGLILILLAIIIDRDDDE